MRRIIRGAVALGVTAGVLAWLVSAADLGQWLERLRAADPLYVLAAVTAALTVPFWRAARLKRLVAPADRPLGTCWRIVTEALFWSFLLPMKLGELSLPLLVHRRTGTGLGKATSLLLLIRLSDLGTVIGIGLVAVLPWLAALDRLPVPALTIPLALLLGIAALTTPMWLLHLHHALRRWPPARRLPELPNLDALALFAICGQGIGLWLAQGLAAWLMLQAIGFEVGVGAALVAGSAAAIGFALPISGFMGLGPQQVAFASVINLNAISWSDAAFGAASVYLVALFAMALPAAVSFAWSAGRTKAFSTEG